MAASAPPTVRPYRPSGDPAETAAATDRVMLAPVTRAGRAGRRQWRAGWMLALSLIVLLLGAFAVSATAQPTTPKPDPCAGPEPRPPLCLPAPSSTPPGPTISLPEGCQHNPLPYCFPATSPGQPTTTTAPSTCSNIPPGQPRPPDCIPQPTTTAPAPSGTRPPAQPGGGPSDDCGITDIGACITEAIDGFFRSIVTAALNPLLDLLSKTLLSTPTLDSLPRIGELWSQSWEILLACYGILVLIAGLLVMAYESVQTRHSIKEIAPRIAVGFLAGALSLFLAGKAIDIANALSQAVMGGGVDPNSAAESLKNMIISALSGGMFIIFIGMFLAGMIIALLVTYIVRVCLTVILIAGAPIMLMFHALPQTDGIARTWWKAFGGCLAIQVVQSLTLVTAMRVFLAPGGFTLFGPTTTGLVNLLISLALMYILFKIPFWILGSLRHGGHRSFLGGVARAYIMGKAIGLLGGRSRARSTQSGHTPRARARRPSASTGHTSTSSSPRASRAAHQTHRGRPQPPRFQQATPQVTTHHLATGSNPTRPATPRFSTAPPPSPVAASSLPPRPPGNPAAPRFQAASSASSTPTPTRTRASTVPPHLRFHAATRSGPVPPTRVGGPPPPAPTFQPSTPTPGSRGVRARSHTPSPVRFHAPQPPLRCVQCGSALSSSRCANAGCAASPHYRAGSARS